MRATARRAVGSRRRARAARSRRAGRAPGRWLDRLREADPVVGDQLRAKRRRSPAGSGSCARARRAQAGVGEVELDHPAHARAPEAVQRLVLVADAEQRVLRRGEDPDQQLLRRLDVLVLVDEHVREAALPALAQRWSLAQRADGEHDHVVEVVDALLGLLGLVERVDARRSSPSVISCVRGAELAGVASSPSLMSEIAARASPASTQVPVSRAASAHSRFHWLSESCLGRRGGSCAPRAASTARGCGTCAPRTDCHACGGEPLGQLDARVAVERCRQNPLGAHAAAQQLAHPLDQYGRLAAARGRDDLHRARRALRRRAAARRPAAGTAPRGARWAAALPPDPGGGV